VASSMAMRDGFFFLRASRGSWGRACARGDEQELEGAVEVVAAGLAGSSRERPEWMRATRSPAAVSLVAWSSMRAMSGGDDEAVPPRAMAGSW